MFTDQEWKNAPAMALALVRLCTEKVAALRQASVGLPGTMAWVLHQPGRDEVHVGFQKEATALDVARWQGALGPLADLRVSPCDVLPETFASEPWLLVKQAADPVISTAAKALNYQPSGLNQLFGGPSPLAAALASGLLGGGLGYVAGTIGEKFLPERDFEEGRLRRSTALLGAAAGVAPALAWGAVSHAGHPETPGLRAWVSGWPFRKQDYAAPSPIKQAAEMLRLVSPAKPGDLLRKEAFAFADQGLGAFAAMPQIPKDDFGRVVWQDQNTPFPIRAATSGLLETASIAAGNNSMFVSPYDVARVTANGAVRGMIVGKTLGALAGLRPEAQQQLQQQGVWASMLMAVVPQAFPGASMAFSR